ncbi:MAG: PQQ-binding-like beta-propeller repeat protein, partial [Armatimonadetes bacterium]|nr:PQQ-binding-like beta-propeller repeat protein [Armatimonadota bacterium]
LTRELNNFQKFGLLMGSEELHIIDDHRQELSISPEEMALILRSVVQQDFEVEYWFSRADELEAAKCSILSSLLTDENRDVRLVAYRHIEDHLDESLIPALAAGLDYDQPEVRNLAAQYLRGMKRELSNWLRKGDERQQIAAARGLGHIAADDQRPAPALIETLSDEQPELTAEVIHYLRKTDSPRNISTLINRITSHPDVPWAVAYALGRLCSAEAGLDRLQRAAHSNPKSARLQYATAVAHTQRREFEEARTRLERAEQLASGSAAARYLAEAREAMQAAQQQRAVPTDQWAMFAGGPAHHGFSEQAITPPLHEVWSTRTQAAVVASPVTTAGRVYTGARDGTFFALDGAEGHILWTFAAGNRIEGAAALAGDLVIFGAGDGRLYALNQATGQRHWERALAGPVRGACTVGGDQLFVGDESGTLWAVDWATGTTNWQMATDQEIISAPAVCEETVVVGSWDTGLYAVSSTDGQLRWRLDTDGAISCSPAINESTVYCGSDDFSMYAVNLASGQIQWQVNVGGMVRSAPAIAGGRLVFGSTDGRVYCLDANTGEQLWQHATDEEVLASATITGDFVYIGSKDGVLYALDLASGQVKWEHHTVYGIYSTPCVAAGTLYIGIAYYYVSAFAPQ